MVAPISFENNKAAQIYKKTMAGAKNPGASVRDHNLFVNAARADGRPALSEKEALSAAKQVSSLQRQQLTPSQPYKGYAL